MLKKLPFLSALLMGGTLLSTQETTAQINYSQDFETSYAGSLATGFYVDPDGYGCEVSSLWVNLYLYEDYEKSYVSESVGLSNGAEATMAFDYKIVAYSDFSAYPNDPEWGSITLQYSASQNGPWTTIETIDASNHEESDVCTAHSVTFTPPVGPVYYRFVGQVNGNEDIDALFFADNITITQAASASCSGTPVASNVVGGNNCTYSTAVLGLDQYYTESGIAFQWESSSNGVDYAPIAGATGYTYNATVLPTAVWYRATITCTELAVTVTATPLQVLGTGLCYCTPSFSYAVEPITSVEFAGLLNETAADVDGTPALEDFTTSVAPAQVIAGNTYAIYLQGNTDGNWSDYFTVYFDFNADGDFTDDGETINITTALVGSDGADGQIITSDITIPATATIGVTRFRVFKRYSTNPTDPCGTFGYGQAEDYALNIVEDTNAVGGFNKNDFKFSPNPVSDVLTLQHSTTINQVNVINMLGQTVLTQQAGATAVSVNMASLQSGMYLVKVTDAKGGSTTVKVMKN